MITKKLSNSVAGLSTGHYYGSVAEWYAKLERIMEDNGYVNKFSPPQVYNNEGRCLLTFESKGLPDVQVFWTYYRMPSFNWEIICYAV